MAPSWRLLANTALQGHVPHSRDHPLPRFRTSLLCLLLARVLVSVYFFDLCFSYLSLSLALLSMLPEQTRSSVDTG